MARSPNGRSTTTSGCGRRPADPADLLGQLSAVRLRRRRRVARPRDAPGTVAMRSDSRTTTPASGAGGPDIGPRTATRGRTSTGTNWTTTTTRINRSDGRVHTGRRSPPITPAITIARLGPPVLQEVRSQYGASRVNDLPLPGRPVVTAVAQGRGHALPERHTRRLPPHHPAAPALDGGGRRPLPPGLPLLGLHGFQPRRPPVRPHRPDAALRPCRDSESGFRL